MLTTNELISLFRTAEHFGLKESAEYFESELDELLEIEK